MTHIKSTVTRPTHLCSGQEWFLNSCGPFEERCGIAFLCDQIYNFHLLDDKMDENLIERALNHIY